MANQHISSTETIFGRIGGPLSRPAKNTQGFSRGWKASSKMTESGFIMQGLGLDSVMRGAKVDDVVPDIIVIDDIDERHDTLATTKKKIEILTETILPAGTSYCTVFGLQNLILANGVFAQLVDGRADFLADRIVDGPYKAIEGIQTERQWDDDLEREITRIVAGTPTWSGQDIETCQRYVIRFGWPPFDREMQNNVKDVEGALWTTEMLNETRVQGAPDLTRKVVAVDPATSSKKSSNETGIIAMGRTAVAHGYVIADKSGTMQPKQWGRAAILLHDEVGADCVVIETNQGGEMARDVIVNAAAALHREGQRKLANVRVKMVHASKGKRARAEPVAQAFDEKRMHLVGEHAGLEEQMTTWNASDGSESPDRVDAMVWAAYELGICKEKAPKRRRGGGRVVEHVSY